MAKTRYSPSYEPFPQPPEHHELLEETNQVFYNISNLPLADQHDWEKRMIYRVFLRSPYPPAIWQLDTWYTIHLGLVNEMSLFPQKALQKGVKFECVASLLDTRFPERAAHGLQVDLQALGEEQKRWLSSDMSSLSWPGFSGGRGACNLHIKALDRGTRATEVLLKIGIARGEEEDKLYVLPLIIGPFQVTQTVPHLTGEEVLFFHRQLTTTEQGWQDSHCKQESSSIVIRESPEIAIPGKIWDSALFASQGALEILLQTSRDSPAKEKSCPTILDLSAGTGVCGIWMAVMMQRHFEQARVILSDLEEALPVMETNVKLNQHLITNAVKIDIQVLRWGVSEHVKDLGVIDIVIACDLIYEAELLPALVETLDAVTTRGVTSIIIGYKQRGLTREEKEHLWSTMAEKFVIEKMEPVVACMERICKSDAVGVELWRLSRPDT